MKKIKIVAVNKAFIPAYETEKSAGLDLRANITKDITFKPMDRKLISTGIKIALPDGYEAQIRPRSGFAMKEGMTVLNAPGTIDADYRGEIRVLLVNLSNKNVKIKRGDRIAQMVIAKYEQVEFEQVVELDQTERGERGFGHTGRR